MLRKFKFMAAIAVALCAFSLTSCSETKFDAEGVKTVVKKGSKEITASDIDYLLDQTQAFAKEAKKAGSAEEYAKSLDKETAGTIISLAFTLASLEKSGKMSESQAKRYQKMQGEK